LIKSKITVHFSNTIAEAMTVYICPTNFDEGSNSANYQKMMSNPNSVKAMTGYFDALSTVTGSQALTKTCSTEQFAGAKWNHMPDPYTGDTGGLAAPVNQWFWNIGAVSAGASFVLMRYVLDIECEIAFFEEATPGV